MSPSDRGAGPARHCPECGVELKAGAKYCDFCGSKVAAPVIAGAAPGGRARGPAAGVLRWIAVGCLAIGILAYVGTRLKERSLPPVASPSVADGKHKAAAACETSIRRQARGPFRVIAFRTSLVAEEQDGYVVSGTVELQSAAGELQRKRYFCRVRPDAGAGVHVDEGNLY